MEVETRDGFKGEASLDWRGRPCNHNRHGGMRAASFVLGLQAFEIMAIAAVGNNLITYVFNEMHFPLPKSANVVTNFIGTVFLSSLLGGFLSDSYLGCFKTMLLFGLVELSGFVLLSTQAHLPRLRPPKCDMMVEGDHGCVEAGGLEAAVFFTALYLIALGSGCLKPNMISHGADQFRGGDDARRSKRLSTYFNTAYFSFCAGELIALTVLVWVQTRSGMDVGFAVSTAAMAAGLASLMGGMVFYSNKPPQGSIFAPTARVFVAALVAEGKQVCPSHSKTLHGCQNVAKVCAMPSVPEPSSNAGHLPCLHAHKFRFLDKACIQNNTACAEAEVLQAKTLLSLVPIFACTIVFNTILAQLQTFSVQQGRSMDTRIAGSFQVPPASLQAIPYLMLIVLVPLYETGFVPIARRLTATESGISPLSRIGVGLFTVTFSMVSAAVVERRRRIQAVGADGPMSILWIAPQFLIFGLSEMFTAVGLIEFFYKQSVGGMQSFLTAMTYCSYSFGFFLSSLLVSLVNRVTSSTSGSKGGWLGDNDLNKDRLDLFYWMLAGLSLLNFFNYLYWSRWYSYEPEARHDGRCVDEKHGDIESRAYL